MKTFTIGWLNKCRCGNKSHTVKTARGNETALWDDDAVKCNSCGRGGVIQVCEGQARVLWETDEEMAEGKPMSTLTKEWLHQTIAELEEERDATPGAVNEDAAMALAAMKLALASLEAEPVAWRSLYYENHGLLTGSKNVLASWQKQGWECEPLYTAPPAPVSVPDEATPENIEILASTYAPRGITYQWDRDECNAAADSWNACRAAMLQSADQAPVKHPSSNSVLGWLRADYQNDNRGLRGNAPLFVLGKKDPSTVWGLDYIPLTSNSPVIPDGWVMVPFEPTAEMISSGITAHFERGQIQIHDRPAPGPMECAYVAMLSAAPQQEVK